MGKQVTELDTLPSFTDTSLLPVHNGAGLKKGRLSQLASYLGTKFINPNLLINPDFKINQRGQSEYAYETSGATKYTADRWRTMALNVKTATGGILLSAANSGDEGGYFSQVLEDAVEGDTTLSFKVSAVVGSISFNNLDDKNNGGTLKVSSDGIYTVRGNNTIKAIMHLPKGSSCKIEWIKLEQGSIATPFVAPNQAEELLKCLRFTHVISMDNLIGAVNGNKVFVRVSSPLKEGATIKYMKGYMSIAVENEGKDINVGSANIANKGSYVLAFNTNSDTNYVWKACVMSNFTILLDAELY